MRQENMSFAPCKHAKRSFSNSNTDSQLKMLLQNAYVNLEANKRTKMKCYKIKRANINGAQNKTSKNYLKNA